jgi:hypothetical protein
MRVEGVSVCRMRNANGSGDCPVRPLVGRNRGIWPELEDWRYHKPQSPSFGVALNVSLKQSAEQIPSSSKTTHAPVLIRTIAKQQLAVFARAESEPYVRASERWRLRSVAVPSAQIRPNFRGCAQPAA